MACEETIPNFFSGIKSSEGRDEQRDRLDSAISNLRDSDYVSSHDSSDFGHTSDAGDFGIF
ncbi:hypothetical protein [Acuticoccus sediminis]|uniref:hypothetical protein n=1 Tax=Acuticoccus sediminis TaxID=2184697 RepID=UPI001CFC48A6|nr:hypothetical protein [Acuticoccus sediminis]